MSELFQTSEPSQSFAQRRRWLKTHFSLSRRHLDYSVESKKDSALHKKLAWDTIAARSAYFHTIEPDRELRWVAFAVTALAFLASFRGGPQPLTFILYAGVMATLLAGLWLTQKLRRVGYTAIPASGINILVLDDRQHDTIIDAIEERRAAALRSLADPTAGISIRVYLRRLRWLVENHVLSGNEFTNRRKLVLPHETIVAAAPAPVETTPVTFRQRRLGTAIDVELLADRLALCRATLFGATESSSVSYRDLKEPSAFYGTDHQYELAGLLFAWCAIAIFAWMSAVTEGHPEGYYVGGVGFRRAIVDFGPPLVAMVVCAAVIPLMTRLRYAEPYPGIRLLRDKQYDTLLAAIEERRIAVQRALAKPDPLLAFEEQMQILSELRDSGVICKEEQDRAAKRAAFVCDNPQLDLPAIPQPQRRRAVH